MNNRRNISIDIIKAICSFMVVFIHAGENNSPGTYIKVICSCAVPFFFLVSGYYLSRNISAGNTEYVSKQLKKIGVLFLISNVLYALYRSILMVLFQDDLAGFWKKSLSCESIISFLLFNESPFAYHLWYVGALLYALFVFYLSMLFLKNKTDKLIPYMSLLLLLSIVFGFYSKALFGKVIPIYLTRNFITIGIPAMAIGCMLHSVKNKYRHLHGYALLSIIILSMAVILERFLIHRMGIMSEGGVFIMTLPLSVSMILFAITDEYDHSSPIMKGLADIGRRDSSNIYVYHLLFLFAFDYMITNENPMYLHIKPLLIFVITLTFSRGLQFAGKKVLKHPE